MKRGPKRLFILVYKKNGKTIKTYQHKHGCPTYFNKKRTAKELRNALNEGRKHKGWCVSYGPDHWRYNV